MSEQQGIIENLDELSLPRRKVTLLGTIVTVRRVDEFGLRDWAGLERIEREMNEIREEKMVAGSRFPTAEDAKEGETAVQTGKRIREEQFKEMDRLTEEEIKLRCKLINNYIHEGLENIPDSAVENISDVQFNELSRVFTQPLLPLRAEEAESDSTPEISPDSTDSMESETG